jgi:hypothetical protein
MCENAGRAIGFERGDKVSLMNWCDDEEEDGAESKSGSDMQAH